jgi:multidrug resistance efflux pump
MTVDNLAKWETGPDVLRAKRALSSAEAQLTNLQQQQKEAKGLYDRGIIPRNELEGLDKQVKTQADQLAASRLDLGDALDRGNAGNRRVAELAQDNARAEMDRLKSESAETIVRTPESGVIMSPPASSSSDRPETIVIERGVHLSRGQALFTIAGLERFVVEARINEVDINKIRVRQPVDVESDSFPGPPIRGEVTSVGVEADQPGKNGGTARFVVRTIFSPDEKRRALIRVGMSARLAITTYANENAIIVPVDAISSRDGQKFVRVIDPTSGEVRNTAVELGASTPRGLEVKTGLVAGATVLLP